MFDYLYEWIKNIAFYMVLVTAVTQLIPNQQYKKYIRFFTGLVLVLLMTTPVLQLLGMEADMAGLYKNPEYEKQIEAFEEAGEIFYGTQDDRRGDGKPVEDGEHTGDTEDIKVEEIQID